MSSLLDRLHAAAKPYLTGWGYPADKYVDDRAAYAWPAGIKGPPVAKTAAEKRIRCSTMTASILMRCYPSAPWTVEAYAALGVWDANLRDGWDTDNPDSPIDCAVRMGIGVRVDGFVSEALHLVQGVESFKPFHGHAFFAYSRGNGVLDVLESTSLKLVGPRWRTTTAADLHAGDGKKGKFPAALYIARLVEAP